MRDTFLFLGESYYKTGKFDLSLKLLQYPYEIAVVHRLSLQIWHFLSLKRPQLVNTFDLIVLLNPQMRIEFTDIFRIRWFVINDCDYKLQSTIQFNMVVALVWHWASLAQFLPWQNPVHHVREREIQFQVEKQLHIHENTVKDCELLSLFLLEFRIYTWVYLDPTEINQNIYLIISYTLKKDFG